MDPFHPILPIEPATPAPPSYNRVERIQRDQQREPAPDWQGSPQEDSGEQPADQFEDEYDPEWEALTPREGAYGPDGHLHEPGPLTDDDVDSAAGWDPGRDGERRARPRPADADDGADGGPHIDISA